MIATAPSATAAPPVGPTPSLARLAYNRLGFGPLPGAADFNDLAAFTAYLDSQLAPDAITDSACSAYVAGLDRTDPQGNTMPPLDAPTGAWLEYVTRARAGTPHFNVVGLLGARLRVATRARAALSERQLFEAMVDFWNNHLNTTADNLYKSWEDHHVMRAHALGSTRTILEASAQSPSMLDYLSNKFSDAKSPNENYGRELLELHTLGTTMRIPGDPRFGQPNYSEEDVRTAARVFTGWTNVRSPDGSFYFNTTDRPPSHDSRAKRIYLGTSAGYAIPAGGIEQGQQLLDILVGHQATAWFISWKLCQRFISDAPETFCPEVVLIGKAAFEASGGDIKTTLRALLTADVPGHDFKGSWGQKIKRPFEFYISALRALGVSAADPQALYGEGGSPEGRQLGQLHKSLGQVLFECAPPTGYPDVQQAWMNSNQVFTRWTMANTLVQRLFGAQPASGSAPVNARLDAYIGANTGTVSAAQTVDRLIATLLGFALPTQARAALIDYLSAGGNAGAITSSHPTLRPLIGVLLASPYFQFR